MLKDSELQVLKDASASLEKEGWHHYRALISRLESAEAALRIALSGFDSGQLDAARAHFDAVKG